MNCPCPLTEADSERFLELNFSTVNDTDEEVIIPYWVDELGEHGRVLLGHLILRTFKSLKTFPSGLLYPVDSLTNFACVSASVPDCVKYVKTVQTSSMASTSNHVMVPAAASIVKEIDLSEMAITADGAELVTVETVLKMKFDRRIMALLDVRWLTPSVMQILLDKSPKWRVKVHGELDSQLIDIQRCHYLYESLQSSRLFDIEDIAIGVVMHFPLHLDWWRMIRSFSTTITLTPGKVMEFVRDELLKLETIRVKNPGLRLNENYYGRFMKNLTNLKLPKFRHMEIEDTDILLDLSGFLVIHGKNLLRLSVKTIWDKWSPAPFSQKSMLKFAPELFLGNTLFSNDQETEELADLLGNLEDLEELIEASNDTSRLRERVERPLTKYVLSYVLPALRRYCPKLQQLEIEFETPAASFSEFMLFILDSIGSPRESLSYSPVCLVGDLPFLLMPVVLGLVRNWKNISLRFSAPLKNTASIEKVLRETMSYEMQFHDRIRMIILCEENLIRAEALKEQTTIRVEYKVPPKMLFADVGLKTIPDYLASTAYRYSLGLNLVIAREISRIVAGQVFCDAEFSPQLSDLADYRTRCHLNVSLMIELIENLAAKELYVSSATLVSVTLPPLVNVNQEGS
ncbi:hypothetical protein HDE_12949 [Halotydeus destructor]|nr:hypothetical protein HDE_12949 [Halotydeus destructor]